MTAKRSCFSKTMWWVMLCLIFIIPVLGRSTSNHERPSRRLQYLALHEHGMPPRMERRIPGNNDWASYNQMEAAKAMARRESAPDFEPEPEHERMEADTANTPGSNRTSLTNSTTPNLTQNQTDSTTAAILVPDSSKSQSSSGSSGADSSHDEVSDGSSGSDESNEAVSPGIALLPSFCTFLFLSSMLSML
ncbi:unnamed protein product [Albugo candida]|uniref:RxLR effector protein n=1 Tax=Albugo candida TaxID=65357 RepID=A0A024G6M5_9STRA|nr:unnamed protein product [Albugo candida]|eukprot:CCI42516.1 unnamed protein product [Albugo candida]